MDHCNNTTLIISPLASVGGPGWDYFSATCWFFGRNLYDQLQYPIGLIDTDWGGTRVEAWSSLDALAKCNASLIRYWPTLSPI